VTNELRSKLDRIQRTALVIGVIGAAFLAWGFASDRGQFFRSYLFGYACVAMFGLGSLVPHKGFDLLVDAYARLRDPAVDLLIAGDGSEAAALGAQIARLGLTDRVRLLGPVTDSRKVSLYRSAEWFVCPSRREPFANVILEALASGLPVVATDVGGNREMVKPECNGLLCQPESPEALAAAIQRLLDQPAFASGLRSAAAASVAGHDWSQVATRYVEVYRAVVAGARRLRP
jgi:glycosyltransferase involved in cell wall biosynthesis